jgi:hypothetical protein
MVDFEDNDDIIYRDIEILQDNNFEEFHNAILDAYNFTKDEMASFYLCDENWEKLREIALFDMNLIPGKKEILVMFETKIGQIIRDEDQRLIYTYDFLNDWNFFIEVLAINETNNSNLNDFPKLIKSYGEAPKQSSRNKLIEIDNTNSSDDQPFSDDIFEGFDDFDDFR